MVLKCLLRREGEARHLVFQPARQQAVVQLPDRAVRVDATDQRLSDELDKVNAAATQGVAPSRELTVQILDDSGKALADTRAMLAPLGAKPPGTWLVDRPRDPLSTMLRVQNVPVLILFNADGKVLFNGTAASDGLWTALRGIQPSVVRPPLSGTGE